MIRPKLILSFIPLLLISSSAFGANPVEVLRRAEVADKYVSYRGMKVAAVCSISGRDAAIIKVVHMKPDKTRTEYFSPQPMSGIIVIENGDELWRYNPGESCWEQLHHTRTQVAANEIRRGAYENYDIRLIGTERVAGRLAYVIFAAPKHAGEAGHRIWIDKDHYLIMRTQVESPHGTILSSSRYMDISFNPGDISPIAFKVSGKIKASQKKTDVSFKAARPKYLPEGYRLIGISSVCFNGHASVHLQFSNGANIISLFERTNDNQSKAVQIHSKYTKVYTWTRGNMVYTLIGDIALPELKKIAASTN